MANIFAKNPKLVKKFISQLQNKWKIAYIFMEKIDNNAVVAIASEEFNCRWSGLRYFEKWHQEATTILWHTHDFLWLSRPGSTEKKKGTSAATSHFYSM